MLLISLLIHRVMLTLTLWTMLATTVVGETNTNALFFKNSTRINKNCFQSRVEWLFSRSTKLLTKLGDPIKFYHYPANLSMDFWKEKCTMILNIRTSGEKVFLSQMLLHLWNLIKGFMEMCSEKCLPGHLSDSLYQFMKWKPEAVLSFHHYVIDSEHMFLTSE